MSIFLGVGSRKGDAFLILVAKNVSIANKPQLFIRNYVTNSRIRNSEYMYVFKRHFLIKPTYVFYNIFFISLLYLKQQDLGNCCTERDLNFSRWVY